MGIENLKASFLQTAPTDGINEFQFSSNAVDTAQAAVFFQHLAEQMAEMDSSGASAANVDHLQTDLIAAANALPGGNILPPPGIVNPQSAISIHAWNDVTRSRSISPLPADQMPVTPRIGTETIHQRAGTAGKDTPFSPDLHALEGLPEIDPANAVDVETENPDLNGVGKLVPDDMAISKSELATIQTTPRTQFESGRPAVLTIERPVHDPEWKQELGDRIVWMTRNTMAAAELKVNPPQIGPVEVRIQLNNEQLNVVFASQNAAVREAIEASVPRLREMMGAQQMNLISVDISHSFMDQRQHQPTGHGGGRSHGEPFSNQPFVAEEIGPEMAEPGASFKSQGMLNYYV